MLPHRRIMMSGLDTYTKWHGESSLVHLLAVSLHMCSINSVFNMKTLRIFPFAT